MLFKLYFSKNRSKIIFKKQVHTHDLYIRHFKTRCQVKVMHLRQEIQTSQKQQHKQQREGEKYFIFSYLSASMYFLALADYMSSNSLPFALCQCVRVSYKINVSQFRALKNGLGWPGFLALSIPLNPF